MRIHLSHRCVPRCGRRWKHLDVSAWLRHPVPDDPSVLDFQVTLVRLTLLLPCPLEGQRSDHASVTDNLDSLQVPSRSLTAASIPGGGGRIYELTASVAIVYEIVI